jgi:hypothetical protein
LFTVTDIKSNINSSWYNFPTISLLTADVKELFGSSGRVVRNIWAKGSKVSNVSEILIPFVIKNLRGHIKKEFEMVVSSLNHLAILCERKNS